MHEEPILILGGSYAGLLAAARLRMKCRQARVLLIADQADFQQRVRWHEVLAGRRIGRAALAPLLARAGIEFVQARISAWDPERRLVTVRRGEDEHPLHYQALICALGSVSEVPPCARDEHLWQLGFDEPLDERAAGLRALAKAGGCLTVIGGGLAGVECASELAERYPGLQVWLISPEPPLADFCPAAREHALAALQRLGVRLLCGRVARIKADGVHLDDGRRVSSEQTLWCGGLRANPLLAETGLPLSEDGRLQVGADLRVLGWDHLWAAGDCAAVPLGDGRTQRLACATALPSGAHAGEALGDWLNGTEPEPFRFAYVLRCLSLGRRDGIWQHTDALDGARPRWLGGRAAALIKWMLCTLVWVAPRWELRWGLRVYHWPRPEAGVASLNKELA